MTATRRSGAASSSSTDDSSASASLTSTDDSKSVSASPSKASLESKAKKVVSTALVQAPVSPPARMPRGIQAAWLLILAVSLLAAFHLVPVYVHMLLVVCCTLYIGCFSSVRSHADSSVQTERMATRDVYMFPLIGSVVLFSLYCIYKFLPRQWVNIAVKSYFFIFGLVVLTIKIGQLIGSLLDTQAHATLTKRLVHVRNPIDVIERSIDSFFALFFKKSDSPSDEEETSSHIDITPLDLLGFLVASAISVVYLQFNHWFTSNLFGIAFSVQGIELLSLGSYMNGVILLSGLFFYDIFWVFGTEVMVTVAKNFDAPIKLLFPQAFYLLPQGAQNYPSMLGLGDIVIPGIFLALLLRFDYAQYKARQSGVQTRSAAKKSQINDADLVDVPTPYFWSTLVAYFIGLTTTIQVMYWFRAAQPALLYLVPAVLISSVSVAAWRGEFKALVKYTEGDDAPATETVEKKES